MALRSDNHYRDVVLRTLGEAGIRQLPVDVYSVAVRVGLPVAQADLPRWFHGTLVYEDGMPVAVLNSRCDEFLRRQTLAHMLSHLLVRLDDSSVPYPRGDADHRLADVMAREFLMPRTFVTQEALRWFNDSVYLARLFGVPEGDMLSRMHELGLVKRSGVSWGS